MAFKMKNSALKAQAAMAGCPRTAAKMKMESPAKMKKSPMEKELVGKQHNLPEELKAKIEAAPAKMRNRKGAMDTEAPLKMRQDGKGKPGVRRRDKDPMKVDKKDIDRRERENPNRDRGKGYIPRDKNPGLKPFDPSDPRMRKKLGTKAQLKGESPVKLAKTLKEAAKTTKAQLKGEKIRVVDGGSKMAKKAKADYEKQQAKKKAKADAKAESKRVQQENLKVSRERAKNLGMTMKEYEKHLRSKMLKSQRKRILGF